MAEIVVCGGGFGLVLYLLLLERERERERESRGIFDLHPSDLLMAIAVRTARSVISKSSRSVSSARLNQVSLASSSSGRTPVALCTSSSSVKSLASSVTSLSLQARRADLFQSGILSSSSSSVIASSALHISSRDAQRGSSAVCRAGPLAHGPMNPDVERAMGARDPTKGEIHSDFGIKTQGHADTEHVIKPPESIGEIVGLKNKKCVPCEGGKNVVALSEDEADRLRMQAGAGWRIVKQESNDGKSAILSLRTDIVVKNFTRGLELFQRIGEVAEQEGHHPDLHLESWNKVSVVLSTHSVGGLTENDFIMAAKINDIDISDLKKKPKQKFWA